LRVTHLRPWHHLRSRTADVGNTSAPGNYRGAQLVESSRFRVTYEPKNRIVEVGQ
jgi:hypothetical protein